MSDGGEASGGGNTVPGGDTAGSDSDQAGASTEMGGAGDELGGGSGATNLGGSDDTAGSSGERSVAGAPSTDGGAAVGGAADGNAGTGALGDGGASDAAVAQPHSLVVVQDDSLGLSGRLAVDKRGRVYRMDEENVYRVRGSEADVFLSTDDVADLVGDEVNWGFEDIDIGPDQRMYLAFGRRILRSEGPHQVEVWQDFTDRSWLPAYQHLRVLAEDQVVFTNEWGLSLITPSSAPAVYNAQQLGWAQGCATENLAVARSGVFLYEPGCNTSPLVRGNTAGTGVGLLYETEYQGSSPLSAANFLALARDWNDGFYVLIEEEGSGKPQLYHLTESSTQAAGIELITTTPTFAEAREAYSPVAFSNGCSMAAAPDGSLYIQSYYQLWRVWPH